MLNDEHVDILVVEANSGAKISIEAALEAAVPYLRVVAVNDGPEALDFLFARGAYLNRADADPPALILLDLSMPCIDIFSVLGQMQTIEPQNALTLTSVVVFSDFQAVVKKLGQHWMNTHILS